MKDLKRKYKIAILIVAIIASLFYAAIWTNKGNTLSDGLAYTGIVAIAHAVITALACGAVNDFSS